MTRGDEGLDGCATGVCTPPGRSRPGGEHRWHTASVCDPVASVDANPTGNLEEKSVIPDEVAGKDRLVMRDPIPQVVKLVDPRLHAMPVDH